MNKRLLRINGRVVELWEVKGGGVPIVALHGNSSSIKAFESLTHECELEASRFIGIHLPGHQGSEMLDEISIPVLGKWLVEVIRALDIDEYFLLGQSVGGHIMSHAYPELEAAKGLVLVSAPPVSIETLGAAFKPDPTGGALFKSALSIDDKNTMAASLLGSSGRARRCFDSFISSINATNGVFREALGASLMRGELRDEAKLLSQAARPVALFYGDSDAFIEQSYYETVNIDVPLGQGKYKFLAAGHNPQIDHPEKLLDVFRQLGLLSVSLESLCE